jgi:hypothetical protein
MYQSNVAELPLSDGTVCLMTHLAKSTLAREFGVESGRLKSGAGGNAVVVVQTKKRGEYTAAEVPLRELLATLVYEKHLESGTKWLCADGNQRNLLPQNIASTVPAAAPKAVTQKKAKAAQCTDTPAIDRQLDMLVMAIAGTTPKGCAPLIAKGIGILHNRALAEEVLGEAALEIVEAIRAGKFRGKTDAKFYAWIRTIAKNKFKERLSGVVQNILGDVEHDRAELRLKAKWIAEGREAEFAADFASQDSD